MCILLFLDGMSYKHQLSPSYLMLSFKACVSLFIFILDDLSIGESGVLKSPYYDCVTVDFPFYGC